jgi:hypothetical protein
MNYRERGEAVHRLAMVGLETVGQYESLPTGRFTTAHYPPKSSPDHRSPDDLFGVSQQKAKELIIALRTLIGERDQQRKLVS